MQNIPEDWNAYFCTCPFCNYKYHASEGGCDCGGPSVNCYECGEFICNEDDVGRKRHEGEFLCQDCMEKSTLHEKQCRYDRLHHLMMIEFLEKLPCRDSASERMLLEFKSFVKKQGGCYKKDLKQ